MLNEGEILLPGGEKERVLTDSGTGRSMEVVTLANPVTGTTIVPGSESTLQAILAAIISGGGGVTWPLSMDLLLVDPVPVADKVLFYAISDGGTTPNNTISIKLILPDATPIILGTYTI